MDRDPDEISFNTMVLCKVDKEEQVPNWKGRIFEKKIINFTYYNTIYCIIIVKFKNLLFFYIY